LPDGMGPMAGAPVVGRRCRCATRAELGSPRATAYERQVESGSGAEPIVNRARPTHLRTEEARSPSTFQALPLADATISAAGKWLTGDGPAQLLSRVTNPQCRGFSGNLSQLRRVPHRRTLVAALC
jgi:hypothetical protein